MKITKYNHLKGNQIKASSIVGGGGSSSSTIEGARSELDRTIWGQNDRGEDIDGSMSVNGNVNINVINSSFEEEETDGEYEEYEEGGGNLNVELMTTTKDLEVNNDAYINNHLYINYNKNHSHTDNKKCIGEILNGIEKNINTNTEEIDKIKGQIADSSSIDNLLNEMQLLKYGDVYNSVILFSGILERYVNGDNYYISKFTIKDILEIKITNIEYGLMTIEITPSQGINKNMYCYVSSIQATQEKSDVTKNRMSFYKDRGRGAHWFETWSEIKENKTTIYIREFHQGNDDNDTWYSSNWFENGGVMSINLTINGYITIIN